MTDASAMFAGLCVIAVAIAFGLDKIATAIRYKRADVNFTGPIPIILAHGERPAGQEQEGQKE